jgi:hypothetical protein
MSTEIEFVDGLFYKEPRSNAPDYVKGSISIQPAKLAAWCQTHASDEWVNVDVKESKGGKIYCAVNDWKPEGKREAAPQPQRQARQTTPQPAGGFTDDDIPFAPLGKHQHWIA